MKPTDAEFLVEEMARKYTSLSDAAKDNFVRQLTARDVSSLRTFQLPLPKERYETCDFGDTYAYVSLRRILANRLVGLRPPFWEPLFQSAVGKFFSTYSSTRLGIDIQREDSGLAELIESCGHDFSLLAKVEVFDISDPEGGTFVTSKPLLVIPEIHDPRMSMWEGRNTLHHEEKRFLGLIPYVRKVSLKH